MKKRKRLMWIPVVCVLLVAAIVAAVLLIPKKAGETVYVYGFADGTVGMTDYYGGGSESYGMVTTDRMQPIYLSSTQTIQEIVVTEGQEVHKGDVLLTYDTTLSQLELRQKDISIQQMKLDLKAAQKELQVIKGYVPMPEKPSNPEPVVDPGLGLEVDGLDYLVYAGKGETSLDPKYCWLRSTTMVDETMMQELLADQTEDFVFVVFQLTDDDNGKGIVTEEYGVKFARLAPGMPDPVEPEEPENPENPEGPETTEPPADAEPLSETDPESTEYVYKMSFFIPIHPVPVEPEEPANSGFTAAEIAQMRKEKEQQISTLEFEIRMADAEFSIMQKEADSGQIVAEYDGIVMNLQDPEEAFQRGEPVMKISGGGGFYVVGSVSEFDLGSVEVGQSVQVMSWDTGMTYEGTVVEIGDYPTEDDGYYGGQAIASSYPCKVFIDGSADLRDGYYVSMTLQQNQDSQGSLYLQNAFIRSENGIQYVYVRGEAGLLEKRQIRTGGTLWGEYTKILDGITAEDYLAFPYGKTIREGAATQEGTWENLYGY